MSDSIIVTIITGVITLIGIAVSAKSTRDKMTSELEKQNIIQGQEIQHIKEDIATLKEDVKEHNGYAKMFSQTVPVVQEKLKNLEEKIKEVV